MQTALAVTAGIAIVTGVIHSVLGEWLIFRHLRQGTFVPQLGGEKGGGGNYRSRLGLP